MYSEIQTLNMHSFVSDQILIQYLLPLNPSHVHMISNSCIAYDILRLENVILSRI